MIDDQLVGVTFHSPTMWTGRWVGTAANVPTAVAFTTAKVNIARTGVGALTITLSDPTLGQSGNGLTGVVQNYDAWVNTSLVGGANLKDAVISPIAANAAAFTVQIQFRNGTAVDLVAQDELNFQCWTARTQKP